MKINEKYTNTIPRTVSLDGKTLPYHRITNNREHVLHELLPPQSVASQNYNLRPRNHHFELPNKTSHLTDCNFMQRMLFLETY